MASTHDAYLHVISGGYNDVKRKKVRKLFQENAAESESQPDNDTSDFDLIVGAIEEIHAVGVKNFTIDNLFKIWLIFDVTKFVKYHHVKNIERALATMAIPRAGDTYTVPDPNRLEALRRQHCSEERENERKEAMVNA